MNQTNSLISLIQPIHALLRDKLHCPRERRYFDFLSITVLTSLLCLPITLFLIICRTVQSAFAPISAQLGTIFSLLTQPNPPYQEIQNCLQDMNIAMLSSLEEFNHSFLMQNIGIIVLSGFSCLLMVLCVKYDEKPAFKRTLSIASVILSLFALVLFDFRSIYAIMFILAILVIFICFHPLGDLRYLNFLLYIIYAFHLLKEAYCAVYKSLHIKKRWILIRFLLIAGCMLIAFFCLRQLFPSLSPAMCALIIVSILLLIWTYHAPNNVIFLFHKFILYLCFVPVITIYHNNLSISEPFKILSTCITVFFSIDRIIALSKEIKKEIIQNLPEDFLFLYHMPTEK